MSREVWQDGHALQRMRAQWEAAMQRAVEPFDLTLEQENLDRMWREGIDPVSFQRALQERRILLEVAGLLPE